MEALILLSCLGIFWLISSRRWKRRFFRPLAIILVGYLVLTSPLGISFMTWGLTLPLPADSPRQQMDAIVVLGRGGELAPHRSEVATELWEEKRAPKVFISGMTDIRQIREHLKELGLPENALDGEGCSQSTEENALFTSALLRPQGHRNIVLITDPPHMLRAFWLFQSFQFNAIPHFSTLPVQMSSRDKFFLTLREYVGLAHYAVTGRFRQKTEAELNQPPSDVLRKISEWDCRISPAS